MKNSLLVLASVFISLLIISAPVTAATPDLGLWAQDFEPISKEGFAAFGGDPSNSYSWSMTDFKSQVYVGTNRHHLWSIATALFMMYDPFMYNTTGAWPLGWLPLDPPFPDPDYFMGAETWANEMAGQIWRFNGVSWELVHQSDVMYLPKLVIPKEALGGLGMMLPMDELIFPEGYYPESYGYRKLGTFNGYIYVCGVGTWWPPMPWSQVLRSPTGDPGTWEDVTNELRTHNTSNARGLVEYNGELFVSVGMPPVPVIGPGGPTTASAGAVYCTSDGVSWRRVSPATGLGIPFTNNEIYDLEVFNGELYASTVNYLTGFEVWRTNGTVDLATDEYIWEPVVTHGYGDTWNQYGMTMEVFKDHLYVGSAVGMGMVLGKEMDPSSPLFGFPTRAFDVIRIDTEDNVELVVGAYEPNDPPDGWPTSRTPLSLWPAGFGQPTNVYVWDMEVHDGWLYLGTWDMSTVTMILSMILDGDGGFMDLADLLSEEKINQLISALTDFLSTIDLSEITEENLLEKLSEYLNDLLIILDPIILQDLQAIIELLLMGGDVWKTCDGVIWLPVTVNGFNNPFNYGIRKLHSVSCMNGCGLYVGTGNPFGDIPWEMIGYDISLEIPLIPLDTSTGCEVWYGFAGEPRCFVVPEVPVGTLLAVFGPMGAFGVYTVTKRKIKRPTTKSNA